MNGIQPPTDLTNQLTQRLDIDLVLQAAGLGVWEVDPRTNQVLFDARCRELFGFAPATSLSFEAAIRGIHPEERDRVVRAIEWATNPESDGSYDQQFRTIGVDDGQLRWVHVRGRGYFTPSGEAYRFAGIGQEVTSQVLDRQQLEESETRFRTLVHEATVATCLFMGPDMVIELANEAMIQVWGKGDTVLGKPLAVALPELKDQHFLPLLDHLYTSGQTYESKNGRADLLIDGQLKTFYFNYAFKPLRDKTGTVFAILETAIDVTEQVLTRQQLEEVDAGLRVAVDLAQLGTWSIDVATNGLTYSDRLIEWFGLDPAAQNYGQVIPILEEEDRVRVAAAVAWALDPQSGGTFDELYTIVHPQTGQQRILHARGKTVFDATGKAVRLNGTAQDITAQQQIQLALAHQVQERTQELALANNELLAINEALTVNNQQYVALNDELKEANALLHRSNTNLEQFAYVASHDLQEPLRKIQSFGDMLKTQFGGQLGEGTNLIDRMQQAATRMSVLIRDLLTYSRIATQREVDLLTPLNEVVNQVLIDLDLLSSQTGASIEVDALPTVKGDAGQLGQLFQNLISNALKFIQPGVAPSIHIQATLVKATHLPAQVRPTRQSQQYHRIDVTDNGIGFQQKYVDRIFQVFQRLHGKSHYVGTGIGLAICEKVVTNHGGAITASSQPGQGATFSVYLPA